MLRSLLQNSGASDLHELDNQFQKIVKKNSVDLKGWNFSVLLWQYKLNYLSSLLKNNFWQPVDIGSQLMNKNNSANSMSKQNTNAFWITDMFWMFHWYVLNFSFMHANEQNQDSLFFQPVEVLIHHSISPGTSLQTGSMLSTTGRIKSD